MKKRNDLSVKINLHKDSDLVCVICGEPTDLTKCLILLDHRLLFAGAADAIFVYDRQECLSKDSLSETGVPA